MQGSFNPDFEKGYYYIPSVAIFYSSELFPAQKIVNYIYTRNPIINIWCLNNLGEAHLKIEFIIKFQWVKDLIV